MEHSVCFYPSGGAVVEGPGYGSKVAAHGINDDTYQNYAVTYQATDVVPPPEEFTVKSTQVGANSLQENQYLQSTGSIDIDDGYKAVAERCCMLVGRTPRAPAWVWASIGTITHLWKTSSFGQIHQGKTFGHDVDIHNVIPYALIGLCIIAYSATIQILCRRIEGDMNLRRQGTHAKIVTHCTARK